jgi:hypothetical protein
VLSKLQEMRTNYHCDEDSKKPQQKDKPDIDTNEALKTPYITIEHLIAMKFLYASPAYRLYAHNIKNDLTRAEDDTFLHRLHQLSDKNKIETMILEAEKTYLNLLMGAVQSINSDMISIIGIKSKDIFKINNNDISALDTTLKNYRNLIFPKLNEIYYSSQQIKYLSADTKDEGSALKMAIPKLGIAAAGTMMLNPTALIPALSAFNDIRNEKNQTSRKKSREEILLEDWGGIYGLLYGSYLADYYKQFKVLSYKIAKQFVVNYRKLEDIAIESGNIDKYKQYLKKELIFMIEDIHHIEMRNKLKEIEEIQNLLQENYNGNI